MRKTPFLHIIVLIAFLANTFGFLPVSQAQEFRLPAPGVMVNLSPPLDPPMLKGIKVHPDNPFQFDFILDKGDRELSNDQFNDESTKLIKYFLAGLTIPEKDLWVNLSPYEKERIIPQRFGFTEMGRDLLAEDYMLKQITASLIYPEGETGKKFWKRIYEETAKKFGTTNVPVNTFNKVWIIPEKATVYENAKTGTAYVLESKLKVMLEADYLSMSKHQVPTQTLGSQIVRAIVIPELTKEVNEDKNFIQLRQVYNSLILATWYKKKIRDSILEQVYADKNKVTGVGYNSLRMGSVSTDGDIEFIYQRYLQAFKKGVFNYIKEDADPMTQEMIPRKYFSGGTSFAGLNQAMTVTETMNPAQLSHGDLLIVSSKFTAVTINHAMTAIQERIQAWLIQKTEGKDLNAEVQVTKEDALSLGLNSLKALTYILTDPENIFRMRKIIRGNQIFVMGFSEAKTKRFLLPAKKVSLLKSGPKRMVIPAPEGIRKMGDSVIVKISDYIFVWKYHISREGNKLGFLLIDKDGKIRAEVYSTASKMSPQRLSSVKLDLLSSVKLGLGERESDLMRMMLNLFFYTYPDVRQTDALGSNSLLKDMLIHEYGFEPRAEAGQKGDSQQLFLFPKNENKFYRALEAFPVSDQAMNAEQIGQIRHTLNVMQEVAKPIPGELKSNGIDAIFDKINGWLLENQNKSDDDLIKEQAPVEKYLIETKGLGLKLRTLILKIQAQIWLKQKEELVMIENGELKSSLEMAGIKGDVLLRDLKEKLAKIGSNIDQIGAYLQYKKKFEGISYVAKVENTCKQFLAYKKLLEDITNPSGIFGNLSPEEREKYIASFKGKEDIGFSEIPYTKFLFPIYPYLGLMEKTLEPASENSAMTVHDILEKLPSLDEREWYIEASVLQPPYYKADLVLLVNRLMDNIVDPVGVEGSSQNLDDLRYRGRYATVYILSQIIKHFSETRRINEQRTADNIFEAIKLRLNEHNGNNHLRQILLTFKSKDLSPYWLKAKAGQILDTVLSINQTIDVQNSIRILENQIEKIHPGKQIQEVKFEDLFRLNPYGFSLKIKELNALLSPTKIIKLNFSEQMGHKEFAEEVNSLYFWEGDGLRKFEYEDKKFTWGFILAELIKNAYVHGNHLQRELPIYLYADVKNDLLEVYDFRLRGDDSSYIDIAKKAGLTGYSLALRIIRDFEGIKYEYRRLPQGAVARILSNKDNQAMLIASENNFGRAHYDNVLSRAESLEFMRLTDPVELGAKYLGLNGEEYMVVLNKPQGTPLAQNYNVRIDKLMGSRWWNEAETRFTVKGRTITLTTFRKFPLLNPKIFNEEIGGVLMGTILKTVPSADKLVFRVEGPEVKDPEVDAEFLRNIFYQKGNGEIKLFPDQAMKVTGVQKGGIDLTPANMNVQVRTGSPTGVFGDDKGGIKFHLDPAMLRQLQNAPGFVPVIISVKPLANLQAFLGIVNQAEQNS